MRRLLLLTLAALAFAAQAALAPRLRARQEAAGLMTAAESGEGVAAEVALPTLALGAFRGLATDYLWLRLIALRERGRTYEARQLAEQITRLQPRLPGVWTYLGQHLAYDMAATEPTAQGRWRWIQNGIALLRDRGLRHNPDAPALYYALSRIYLDKVAATLDDFHLQFKTFHAAEMQHVLGDGPLEALASAPRLAVLRAQDPAVDALAAELEALGYGSPRLLLEAERALAAGASPPEPAAAALFERARGSEPWRRLLLSTRLEVASDVYRLDPVAMLAVDRAWGPLDWRSCEAHALYWAARGAEVAAARGEERERFRLERTAMLALKNALRRGRVVFLPSGELFLAPKLELIGPLDARYRETIRLAGETVTRLEAARGEEHAAPTPAPVPEDDGHGHTAPEDGAELRDLSAAMQFLNNQLSAREDFLAEAIQLLAEYGRETDARALLARARQAYPGNTTFALPYDGLLVTLMARRFTDAGTFETRDGMAQVLEGTWTRAFRYLALGEEARYESLAALARASQARWERTIARLGRDDPSARARLALPYDALRARALYRAAQGLEPGLRGMLAERVPGVTLEQLTTPPPELGLPPPRGRAE